MANDMDEVAVLVRKALAAEDPSAFAELLDPAVTWGAPGARNPSCKNRNQVLAWYERGRDAGVRGSVYDVEVLGDRLLVGIECARYRECQGARWSSPSVSGADRPEWQSHRHRWVRRQGRGPFLLRLANGLIFGLSGAWLTAAWTVEILLGISGLAIAGTEFAQAVKDSGWKGAPAIAWNAIIHGNDIEATN